MCISGLWEYERRDRLTEVQEAGAILSSKNSGKYTLRSPISTNNEPPSDFMLFSSPKAFSKGRKYIKRPPHVFTLK